MIRKKRYWLFNFGFFSAIVAACLAGVLVNTNTAGNEILMLAVLCTLAFGVIGAMGRYIELDDKVNKMEDNEKDKEYEKLKQELGVKSNGSS